MSKTEKLFDRAKAKGLFLEPHGCKNLLICPAEILESDLNFKNEIRRSKQKLLAFLRRRHAAMISTSMQVLRGEFSGSRDVRTLAMLRNIGNEISYSVQSENPDPIFEHALAEIHILLLDATSTPKPKNKNYD
ncbi:MAG: hypothetical protein ABIR24_12860 [Verrucomicrobiota bacterium]